MAWTYLCTDDGDSRAYLAVAYEQGCQEEKERTYGPEEGAGPGWEWCCDCESACGDVSMSSWPSERPECQKKGEKKGGLVLEGKEEGKADDKGRDLTAELHNALPWTVHD